jgi:hypothetical protein
VFDFNPVTAEACLRCLKVAAISQQRSLSASPICFLLWRKPRRAFSDPPSLPREASRVRNGRHFLLGVTQFCFLPPLRGRKRKSPAVSISNRLPKAICPCEKWVTVGISWH